MNDEKVADLIAIHDALSGRSRLLMVLFGPVYLLTVMAGYQFQLTPESGSAFWPASGLVLAVLLITPFRTWPVLVIVTIAAESLAAWFYYGAPGSLRVAFDFANPVEALFSATIIRRYVLRIELTSTVHRLIAFAVIAAGAGTALGAFLGAASIRTLAPEAVYWQTWHVWWLGDSLGVLIVTPLLLVWASPNFKLRDRLSTARLAEASLLLGGLAVTANLVFSSVPALRTILDFPYVVFPFLLWGAVRFRPPLVTTACLMMTTIAVWHTVQGRGPFLVMGNTEHGHTLALQACLLVSALSTMILAAAFEDQRHEIRKRVHAERNLIQSQKLDLVGRLAAGVAHDYNNYIMVISSQSEFIARKTEPDDPLRSHARRIADAADRAASLTRRLMAITRSQVTNPKLVDANDLVKKTTDLARHLLGIDIELRVLIDDAPRLVSVDPEQIEIAMLNLVLNARDAMPDGGLLTIHCDGCDVDDRPDEPIRTSQPPRVRIRVIDTGIGMTKEARDRCFEPFFTSGKEGRGTGLGLTTVLDIVDRSGGTISVESERGVGTTFEIQLPPAGSSSV